MTSEKPEQAPVGPTTAAAQSTTPTPTPPAPTAQPTPQPQATAQPTPALPSFQPFATPATTEPQTLRDRLSAGDAQWRWKIGFRAVLVLLGLIGIGCAAWTVANFGPEKGALDYELDDTWAMPWTLITFGISVIWSAVCILVFFVRRPNAPVHPGAQVGMDLVLWLAFIPTGIFAIYAVTSVAAMGTNGRLGYSWWSSSDRYYTYQPSNNTWVWEGSLSSRDCARNQTSSSRYYTYGKTFDNCADEDAYVNALWKGKAYRYNTEMTAVVCQFLMLLIHFILFVWACVDTNRRNSSKVGKDAEKMAADIVMKMIQTGAIIPAPGPAHMRCMPGQMPPQMMQSGPMPPHMMQQMFPQQYPQQNPQQFQDLYGHFAPQPSQAPQPPTRPMAPPSLPAASSSNEKGAGPRFV